MSVKFDHKETPYPAVRRDDSFFEDFKSKEKGTVKVADPYHWQSTPPSQSEETAAFVKAQADFTKAFVDKIDSSAFRTALEENWNYPKFSCPNPKRDGNYYFNYNSGLQAQSAIYRVPIGKENEASLDDGPGGELFFDPNKLSVDGTVAISMSSFSHSGKYWAYAISRSGSDWSTIYVRETSNPHNETTTTKDEGRLDDVVRYIKFSGLSWTHDDKGFFYQQMPHTVDHGKHDDDKAGTEIDSDVNAKLYYHRLGTDASQDILVHEDPDHPHYMWGAHVTDDGRYLVMTTSKDTGATNRTWIADLSTQEISNKLEWHKVADDFTASCNYFANDGTLFYFETNRNAPKIKLVKYDLSKPEKGFEDHVAEDPTAALTMAAPINKSQLLIQYSRDVKDELHLYDLASGKPIQRLAPNLLGAITQVTGRREDSKIFFSSVNHVNPGQAYTIDLANQEDRSEKLFRSTKVGTLDPNDFTVVQEFYESKDGTKIPMYIVSPKSVKKDGTAAAILYGYGGFLVPIDPFFSPGFLTFAKTYNAIFAVPNIRGGGEYGEDWHQGGTFGNKQNVFDDFYCAAKYLEEKKYVAPGRICLSGGSNGGLLVAACVNQHPEAYAAGVADVGVMDMLRFHRYTIGRAWTADYGSSDNPEDFDYLYKYSPLHNVDGSKTYPSVMLLTGDHDDRVVPLHSFKLASTLQHELSNNPNPLLLRVDLKAGHGAGKSTQAKLKEIGDKYSFAANALGLTAQSGAKL